MLILDFDFVEQGIANGIPERESWRAAFALTVSLVWIYTNLLRILAIFSAGLIAPQHDDRPRARPGPVVRLGGGCGYASPSSAGGLGCSSSSRRLALGAGVPAAVPQLHPATAYAAARAADLGAAELGAGHVDGLDRGRRRSAARPRRGRPRARPRRRGSGRARPASRAAAPAPASGSRSAEGWNWSGPKSTAGAAANSGPRIEPSETVRPPSSSTAIVCAAASRRDQARAICLSGGVIGLIVPRSGQVPTSTATPASCSRRTASERWRTDADGQHACG